MHPDRQPRQLNRQRVQVDAVDAAPRDLPPQQSGVVDFLSFAVLRQDFIGLFAQPRQFVGDIGYGILVKISRETLFDAVDGGHQKMPRAHGDIGGAEVEEVVAAGAVAQRFQPRQVVSQRRLQRVIQQVLDGEALGVVGAGGFALARGVVQVDFALADGDVALALGRLVQAVLADAQVGLRQRQLALQQTFVNGAEFAHAQAAEIDRTRIAIACFVNQQIVQDGTELLIAERDFLDGGADGRLLRVGLEQAAVIRRDAQAVTASVDSAEQIVDAVPHFVIIVKGGALTLSFEQTSRAQVERVAFVLVIRPVRQQALVFGVGDEEQAEQHCQRHLIGLIQLLPVGLAQAARFGDGFRQARDDILVDAIAQAGAEVGRVLAGIFQNLAE